MGGNSSDYYIGELTGVIRNKILVEDKINQAQDNLAALENTDPNYAEIENNIMGLTTQLKELEIAEARFKACIENKFDGRAEFKGPDMKVPKLNTDDLFSGEAITPQPRQEENCRSPYVSIPISAKPEKPPKYEAGNNFTRFAKRFREHVLLCSLQGTRLDLYMLSFIKCEQTWDKLEGLDLQGNERVDIDLLIKRYTDELFPPLEATATRAELLSVKQKQGETVEQFCFRISDLACKAGYDSNQGMEDSCLNALITGCTDPRVKERILENNIRDYRDAVKIATQTERIRAINSNTVHAETENPLYSIAKNDKAESVNVSSESPQNSSQNVYPVQNHSGRPYSNRPTISGYPRSRPNNPQSNSQRSGTGSYGYNSQNIHYSPRFIGNNSYYRGQNSRGSGYNPAQNFGQSNNRQDYRQNVSCWQCGGSHYRRNCPQVTQFRGNRGNNTYNGTFPLNGRWMASQ